MDKSLLLLTALFTTTLFSCGIFQTGSYYDNYGDEPDEFGKCYKKCISPKISKFKDIRYASYTGNDEHILENYIENIETETQPANTKWIKKKADRNCQSADPNDCLVWCLVEIPAEYKVVGTMLIDTTVTKEYTYETTTIQRSPSKGGTKVEMAVVCNPSTDLINAIQNKLTSLGYDLSVDVQQYIFGDASQLALEDYQHNNELHTGGFTEETMEYLELDY